MFTKKLKSELEKLNTKRLLAYYKAERRRYNKEINKFICECCGEYMWDIYPKYWTKREKIEKKLSWRNHQKYLKFIKKILSTREHINKEK